jgi:FkbM family methyltransferase
MISYAQNYEDVMARRALGDPERGFYVDVGAADPIENNATYYFYERGWSGINVEPEPTYFKKLVDKRPRDTNLNLAIASERGEAELIVVSERELSTLDASIAARYARSYRMRKITVRTLPLEDILEEHGTQPIDLLKIDVEGREGDVLKSFDLAKWSPKVLIVEATWPCTIEPSHHEWEPGVFNAGYELALFDGLNRFYARADDPKTLEALRIPANLFDWFIQYRWWKLLSAEAKEQLAAQGYPNTS